MKIYWDRPIVTRDTSIKVMTKTKRIAYQDIKKIYWFGRKGGESVKAKI